jgi:Bacteriophage CI repressor helix-turn-helix domain.
MSNELFTKIEGQLARLKAAAGVKTDTALAQALGLKQGSISNAKMRGTIPVKWFSTIANTFHVRYEWLESGTGNMRNSFGDGPGDREGKPFSVLGGSWNPVNGCTTPRAEVLQQESVKDTRIKELEAQLAQAKEELVKAKDEALRAYKLAVEVMHPASKVLHQTVMPIQEQAHPAEKQPKENPQPMEK